MSFEDFEMMSLYLGIGSLVGFMLFIIWDIVKSEKAGKFGAFILFGTLGLGMFGFMIKVVIGEYIIA